MSSSIPTAIHVYTFKEGLLSRLAHDLKLRLSAFEIVARGREVEGRFDPRALRVLGAMRDGQLDADALSASDRDKVQETIEREILRAREHPQIVFQGRVIGDAAPFVVEGTLALCGRTQPLSVTLDASGPRWTGEVEFAPSRWGIKPYRALGGALKLQDRVRVSVEVTPGGTTPAEVLQGDVHTFGPHA